MTELRSVLVVLTILAAASLTAITVRTARRRHDHPGAAVPALAGVRDRGQATTEYALILLGAAMVGLLVVAWATGGGASGRIGQLFDSVVDSVMSRL